MTVDEINETIQELVAMGLLHHTGEYRPDRNGVLQPVYVHIKYVPDEKLTPQERMIKAAAMDNGKC
jgi:hypothetical protein